MTESSLPVTSEGVVAPTHPAAVVTNSAKSAQEGPVPFMASSNSAAWTTAASSRKRAATQNATVYNDEAEEGASSSTSSSSTTPPGAQAPPVTPPAATGVKRTAEVSTEDLDDSMSGLTDIMSMHVGPAYTTNPDGSVCEVYSPPRVVPHAERQGFQPGWSLDLTTPTPEGLPWDFSLLSRRAEARKLVQEQKPLLLIGSPMCAAELEPLT